MRRLLLALSTLLAALGGAALASGVAPAVPATTVSLSGGDDSQTPTTDALSLDDESVSDDTTTTSTIAAPTTTTTRADAPATTSTTVDLLTPTTVSPPTTVPPPTRAQVSVVHHFPGTVQISINDVNAKTWTLAPGEAAGPFTLRTSNEHGDGLTVMAVDTQCGYGDGADYFRGGGTYVLTAREGTQSCEGAPGPMLTIDSTFDGEHYSHSCFGYGFCLPTTG